MQVRVGNPGDIDQILRIQRSTPEASQWNPSDYELLVAETDDEIAGFLVWRSVVWNEGGINEAEILNLAVAKSSRRQGLGRALIEAVPVSNVFLEVRESNAAARALYRKAGFVEAGVRFGYYAHPVESAIVMRLQS